MKKILSKMLLSSALFLTSCAGAASPNQLESSQDTESNNAVYKSISPDEALEIMETSDDYILLDVRTPEEFSLQRIEGSILIPDYEIENSAEEKLTDKSALILVYCRSGRRSEAAAKKLLELGYTNVLDFGGIIDWPYDTVSD